MAFNIFTTQRVSCVGQYDRIEDRIPFKLRGDKRPVHRQFLVDELHLSAVCKCLIHSSSGISVPPQPRSAFLAVSPMFPGVQLGPGSKEKPDLKAARIRGIRSIRSPFRKPKATTASPALSEDTPRG